MKIETLKLLKNLEQILDDIFISIKLDVKDRLMYSFIMSKLLNVEVGHFNIMDNKLIIDASKHSKEERFELIFVPNFKEYNKIIARYYDNEYTFDKTIEFKNDLTIIEEITIDKQKNFNTSIEKRVYKEDELIYSVNNKKTKIDEDSYRYVIIENFIDGKTSKSKLKHLETKNGEITSEKFKYKKKDLEQKIDIKDKKYIYGTEKLYRESIQCSSSEYNKFIEYWKELNETYTVEDYSYIKKN